MSRKPLYSERELAEAEGEELASHERLLEALKQSIDNPGSLFSEYVLRARAGDDWAAREVLHSFCICFEKNQTIPHDILRHFYLAFSIYLSRGSRTSLEKALGLVAPAHRRRGARNKKGKVGADNHPLQIVAYVYLAMKRDQINKQAALIQAAERFQLTQRMIESYDREWKGLKEFAIDELERLAQPVAPGLSEK